MLPASFDPLILQDTLLQTLQRSPLTQQFAVLRAEELIQAVIEKPIVNSLKTEVERLQGELLEQKKLKRTMRSDSKRQTNLTAKEREDKEALIAALREEVQQTNARLEQLSNANDQLRQICADLEEQLNIKNEEVQTLKTQVIGYQKEVAMLIKIKQQLNSEMKAKQNELRISAQKLVNNEKQYESKLRDMQRASIKKEEELQRQIKNKIEMQIKDKVDHEAQLKLREKQIQSLKQERFKLKNQINSLKIDQTQLKAEYQSLKKQEESSGTELQQVRQGLRQIKIGFDRQRKMLNNRLHQLTRTSKVYLKLKNHMKETTRSLNVLKQDHMRLGRTVADLLRKLCQQNQAVVKNILDAVGQKVAHEVQLLATQLKTKSDEVRQAKSEAKSKEEALQRLQNQLSGGNRQVADLKKEAKQHKREEERLRRQLKKTLQQNEAKLTMMERKYAELYTRVTS